MTLTDLRPEPDALLAQARREGRGRLKIFLGAAPGVGKTFAMLEAARRLHADGADVVAAVVETHGRAETEALLQGLDLLPKRAQFYRDRILHEMDLDALLARRPQLALIDELAHGNIPGSRHDKRWQDVEEVLAAGIDVLTTMNVQHLETLNDRVARISGVRVRETVPDAVLDRADEVELVDLPTEELIARLRAGKVYVQDQIARAVQNFFSKGNLTALREMAMRAAADRVDAQLQEHMRAHAIGGPWPAQERILVALTESPVSRTLVSTAKRMADRARVDWIAVTVTSTGSAGLPEADHDALAQALRLADRLGAEVATLHAAGPVTDEILDYARRRNVSRILLGRARPRPWLRRIGREDVARAVTAQGRDFEVTVVSDPDRGRSPAPIRVWSVNRDPRAYGKATLTVIAAGLLALASDRIFPVTSLSLIFMTGVIVVAVQQGLWPSLYASFLSFLTYNFFFTDPRNTFFVIRQDQIMTLVLFLVASVLTGNLAARLRDRALAQRDIAMRTNLLYDFARQVAGAGSSVAVLDAATSHVSAALGCETVLMRPGRPGRPVIEAAEPARETLDLRDASAADYAWTHGEEAGRGSGTLPASRWLFVPVGKGDRRLAVVGIAYPDARSLAPMDRRLLDAMTDQIGVALERIALQGDLEQALVTSEAERLRAALLSSVSHDLRTPLVSIIGAASSLADPTLELSVPARSTMAETIRDEGERLDRYIQNLLDMTRLGHGALVPKRVAADLREIAGSARHRLRGALRDHRVEVSVPEDLPPVSVDPLLIEQVVMNLLDNAAKYAPDGSAIHVSARAGAGWAELSVSDDGPGIPAPAREKVFDMFYRVAEGDGQRAGTGLGLAIARGIVEAHGGRIAAHAAKADGRGTRITLTLPLSAPDLPS
ncbi:sensor histidine kinase KdpD (plasmid) [Paracoccus liaowanqingii]|uniref:histidine kinase n=1 Tax=Paracoccus liaowanqingii TaxID=2560053 RepID=A0A4Y5SSR4_9RHOB|nr:sensor histidine kinase KdpD [Paracoccus liaowanqingii]QDA36542.1 sensor histidine kinase KdpD [Paracoccus liaowanqingii]